MTKVKQRRVMRTPIAAPAPEPTPTNARRKAALSTRRAASARTASAARRELPAAPQAATVTARPAPVQRPRPAVVAKVAGRPVAKPVAKPVVKPPAKSSVRQAAKRSSAALRGTKKSEPVRTKARPATDGSRKSPHRKVVPSKAGRRAATSRGKRPVQPTAPLPREIFIKALDPLRKCGPNTSVLHMFRVDESIGGSHAATHLVFYDRHGWYCVHGRTCQAVEDVRKHGGVKQVGLDYNGRMRA